MTFKQQETILTADNTIQWLLFSDCAKACEPILADVNQVFAETHDFSKETAHQRVSVMMKDDF